MYNDGKFDHNLFSFFNNLEATVYFFFNKAINTTTNYTLMFKFVSLPYTLNVLFEMFEFKYFQNNSFVELKYELYLCDNNNMCRAIRKI